MALILILGLFATSAADARYQKSNYRLRLERSSDGHGNSVFALVINASKGGNCVVEGTAVANYLFVNRKTGKRRWLFPQPQDCIWRVLYFADRPQTPAVTPADARAVVYDITPRGDLDTWGEFRFCTGTNPCLPLRRIFVSRTDGRNLTPLTPSFQISDPVNGLASITQRKDGAIEVSPPYGRSTAFPINTLDAR